MAEEAKSNRLHKRLIAGAIVISIFAVAGVAVYYLLFYLPKVNQQQFLLAQQEKCHEVGTQAYKADLAQYDVTSLDDPQYGYSKKLNTCLYASGYSDQGNPSSGVSKDIIPHNCNAYWEQWVKNSYTNEKIMDIYNFSNYKCQWSQTTQNIEDFQNQRDALFNS